MRPSDSLGGTPPPAFQELCDRADGQVIAAVRVLVRDEKDGRRLEKPSADFVASELGGGDACPFGMNRGIDIPALEQIANNGQFGALDDSSDVNEKPCHWSDQALNGL
ncbi:hypothetical protein N8E88_11400 (plasmid) [Phyllobacterium zundukense]|uniref:Uncharacterized protein n=1 Tax=Phyllobacterium zundukense TaxID=1867719 RepID=A0ACD4CYB4_9HYPH|nr:hypothetical protein N8E88_11400 [Phyllobacterium zundukense]